MLFEDRADEDVRIMDAQAGQTCTSSENTLSWQKNGMTAAQVSAAISAANGGLCAVPVSGTTNADLHGCNLSGKNLTSWSLPGANLKGANVAGATFARRV